MKLGTSDWIQLISSITAIFALIGLIIQIRIQNFQAKSDKRPHFTAVFMNWIKSGDVAVSESQSWDFDKYFKGIIAVSTIDNITAMDLYLVATYKDGTKDYLYLTKLDKARRSLDFKNGMEFYKLEIFFKTSVEEYGNATFNFERYIVIAPEYRWGYKVKHEYDAVVKETNKRRRKAKSNFSTYTFDDKDLKSAQLYNEMRLKRYVGRDKTADAINEYLYGDKDGNPKNQGGNN
ncbi:hypothetical protein [Levilactobacillus tujiorum]|uniref:hypothetical protein n=1 Tax=Levilactobacillus tujiorum TaxID=2912243 RepID=UPI0014578348|nr:hypothetical protein [Levilactobacillus tujiorum]NLR31382.1 hypothetical protein [Levilactobacillus tujiorum]